MFLYEFSDIEDDIYQLIINASPNYSKTTNLMTNVIVNGIN